MRGFLIEYRRKSGEMKLTTYASLMEATLARLALDRTNDDPDMEIVSIGADSEEIIRHSHSRYFARCNPSSA